MIFFEGGDEVKRNILFSIIILVVVASSAVTCAAPAPAPTPTPTPTPTETPIELIYSTYMPRSHYDIESDFRFMDRVELRSNGRVKFYPRYTDSALLGPKDDLDGFGAGLCDIGQLLGAYNAGRGNLLYGTVLAYTSGRNGPHGHAMLDVRDWLEPEFTANNPRFMASSLIGTDYLWLKGDPIMTAEDFKGRKIRSFGAFSEIVNAIGGTAVSIVYQESYQALERGLVDGAWLSMGDCYSIRAFEVTDIAMNGKPGAWADAVLVMNLDSWNELPDDIKKIMDEEARLTPDVGEEITIVTEHVIKVELSKLGYPLYDIPDDLWQVMHEIALEVVRGEWINENPELSEQRTGFLKAYDEAVSKYSSIYEP